MSRFFATFPSRSHQSGRGMGHQAWVTGDLAGEQDEIDVIGVRSFRVVEGVKA
jgi:hypothetical protein